MGAARRFDRPDHRDPVARAMAAMGVAELCAALGIERSKTEQKKWTCPRHGGGSLSVRVKDGSLLVNCHGCGEVKGSGFDLVAAVYGLDARLDFVKVLGIAADLVGVRFDDSQGPRVPPPPRAVAAKVVAPTLDVDTFDRIAGLMLERGRLELDDEVSAYLSRRKLLDLATDAGWFAIPRVDAQRALVDELRDLVGVDALRLSGLVNDSSTMFRHPANRLAIPWRAHGIDGLVVTLQRRALDASEPRYVFPAGRSPSAPFVVVDDLEELESSTPIMLVEGAVDVIAARWVLRDRQRDGLVLGLPGVNNWRAEWTDMLFGREVIIAFDVDKAGETGADRILALCTHAKNVTRRRPRGARDWGAKLEAVRT